MNQDVNTWVSVSVGTEMAPHRGASERTWSVAVEVPMKQPPKEANQQDRGPRPPVGSRARVWEALLISGAYPSRAALARAMGVSRAAVTQALGPSPKAQP